LSPTSSTTTTTTSTTTTTGTGNLNCSAFASPAPSLGSNAIGIYAACANGATPTGFGLLFAAPPAPLTGFIAYSTDNCQITSWSPGTNNYYSCTGANIVFPPGGTRPLGGVTGATPGPTYNFSFYLTINGQLVGPFPGDGSGG
jgi:hypothetical protein